MTTTNRHVLACLSAAALIAGCSTGGTSTSPSLAVTPSPAESASSLVYGRVTCEATTRKARMEGHNEIVLEHFTCTYAVNDPRLDGAIFDGDITTTFEPATAAAARWEATARITGEQGSWSGTYLGALVFWETGPGGPYNYGEGTFTGSGAYKGLVYHELLAGGNATLTVTGSIGPAEQ